MLPIIVIPAYQPEYLLIELVQKLMQYNKKQMIVIVDDGSTTDLSKKILIAIKSLPNIILLEHSANQGKGDALKTAFKYVLAHFPESIGVITADADGQHLPEDIQKIAEIFVQCPHDVILGTRKFTAKNPWRSRFGTG